MPESSPLQPKKTPGSFGVTMRIELPPEILNARRARQGNRGSQAIPRLVTAQADADFQQLFKNLYDAAFVTDMEGGILMANPRSEHAFLSEASQLCQSNILRLIGGADESLLADIRNTLQNNRFVLMQAQCERSDASSFATEISVNLLRLGGQDRMSFFIRDVTLRTEQEEKLRAGNTAIQNASSGIAIADIGGRIEFCNPAFASFFALPDNESAAGLDLRELMPAPGRIDEILEETAMGKTWEGDFELERATGELFYAQASIIANLDAEGNPAGIVVSVLDITTQKQAQQKLEELAATLRLRNTQMQEDLDMAGELQVALLPSKSKTIPDGADEAQTLLNFQHLYCPNGRIGGDFCYIRELSKTEGSVLILDVMGHGVRSALVVATIRGLLEELRTLARDPGALLTQLNSNFTAIFRRMGIDVTFATAFYAVVDARDGVLKYANASHPTPYLLRYGSGEILKLVNPKQRSAALGIMEDTRFETSEAVLEPKDLLLLYTDGLAEAQSPSEEFFMDGRMEAAIAENARQEPGLLLENILNEARAFSGQGTLEDDVCLVSLQVVRLAGED